MIVPSDAAPITIQLIIIIITIDLWGKFYLLDKVKVTFVMCSKIISHSKK